MASYIVKGKRDELKGEHLRHTSVNGVDIYTITSQQRSAPLWLPDKDRKSSRRVKQSTSLFFLCLFFFLGDNSMKKLQMNQRFFLKYLFLGF